MMGKELYRLGPWWVLLQMKLILSCSQFCYSLPVYLTKVNVDFLEQCRTGEKM